jgi:molybdate transport system substrate-binding protein
MPVTFPHPGLLACGALMLILGACGDRPRAQTPPRERVLILAASSTQDALEAIARALDESGGPALTVSTGASNILAQQILAGAPADLFLPAHEQWARHMHDHGMADHASPLLGNALVLVTPTENPAGIYEPVDLLADHVRWVALAGEQVPAGVYGEQVLRAAEIYERLAGTGRIVRGQNVRFALAYVERGEVDAAVVYATDGAAARVRTVYEWPAAAHDPILYPLVLLKHGAAKRAATQIHEFLLSPEAADIFRQHGFRPLSGGPH